MKHKKKEECIFSDHCILFRNDGNEAQEKRRVHHFQHVTKKCEQAQGKMSRLAHIRVEMKKNSLEMNQRQRMMSFEKLKFLKAKLNDLVKIQMWFGALGKIFQELKKHQRNILLSQLHLAVSK